LSSGKIFESKKPTWIRFSAAQLGQHQLHPPVLENLYTGNAFLQRYLKFNLPPEVEAFCIQVFTNLLYSKYRFTPKSMPT